MSGGKNAEGKMSLEDLVREVTGARREIHWTVTQHGTLVSTWPASEICHLD